MTNNALAALWHAPLANFGQVEFIFVVAAFSADQVHVDWTSFASFALASVLAIPDVWFLMWHDAHITWFAIAFAIPLTVDAMELGSSGRLVR
jgi:hypothetical protein